MTDLQAHPVPCERCDNGRVYAGCGLVRSVHELDDTCRPQGMTMDCLSCDGGRKQTFLFSQPCPGTPPLLCDEYCPICSDQPSAIPPGRVAVTTEGTPDFVGDEHAVTMGYVSVTMTRGEAEDEAVRHLLFAATKAAGGQPGGITVDWATALAAAHMLKG